MGYSSTFYYDNKFLKAMATSFYRDPLWVCVKKSSCLISRRRPLYAPSHGHQAQACHYHQAKHSLLTLSPRDQSGLSRLFFFGPGLDPARGPPLCFQLFRGIQWRLDAQEPRNQTAPASLQALGTPKPVLAVPHLRLCCLPNPQQPDTRSATGRGKCSRLPAFCLP